MAEKKNIYPHLVIKNTTNPDKLLAFPLLGIFVKVILLIPVFFVAFFVGVAYFFVWSINSFVILFTGKYWDVAYNLFLKLIIYTTKIKLYYLGLTDTYPGFNFQTKGLFDVHIDKPQKPNRLLAFPVLGFFIRIILLIPYAIFQSVLSNGTVVAWVISWFAVLFKGKYPESLYEFERDSIRVNIAESMYISYLSDEYPSFYMSMNHQTVKILLIIAGAILMLSDGSHSGWNDTNRGPQMHRDYNNTMHNPPQYRPNSGS